jgi:hypothetical protein
VTDVRLSGAVRESLVAEAGQVKVAGLVIEALVSGIGLAGRITGRSSAVVSATLLTSTVLLGGAISGRSGASLARPVLAVAFAGRIAATSRARGYVPRSLGMGGTIGARSAAHMAELSPVLVAGRITGLSRALAAAIVGIPSSAQQQAVTLNVG